MPKDTSFVVKYVFPRSPAFGQLKIDDEIIGVNGKPFTTRHTFGTHYWKNHHIGYEGPMMDFGNAIEESEGRDRIMTLDVKRGEKKSEIKIQSVSHPRRILCRTSGTEQRRQGLLHVIPSSTDRRHDPDPQHGQADTQDPRYEEVNGIANLDHSRSKGSFLQRADAKSVNDPG